MRKEIEALKAMLAAQDAEEAARRTMEDQSRRFHATAVVDLRSTGSIKLPVALQEATEKWAKAFADLCEARAVARHLIRDAEAAARATSLHPVKECFDCDGEPDSCHMNCGPAVKP